MKSTHLSRWVLQQSFVPSFAAHTGRLIKDNTNVVNMYLFILNSIVRRRVNHNKVLLRAKNSVSLPHAHIYMLIYMSAILLRHETILDDQSLWKPAENHW